MLQFKAHCKRYAWLAALFALAALLMQSSLVAQTTGTFIGTVNDPAGAVIPDAKVTLLNERSGDVRSVTTNQVGYFTFVGVIPGTFTVKVEAKGFRTWQRTGVVMNVADTRDISGINLQVGAGTEVVTVESTMGAVETVDSAEHAAVLSTKDIDNLGLVGRNVTELLKILPGVTTVAGGTGAQPNGYNSMDQGTTGSYVGVGYSTNGAPYRGGTALLLDGANILDPGCMCWSTASPNPEFTQEVKVQSANFSAEVPNGPVIFNITSKYGTEKYHGSGYLFTRNGIFNANDHANNINSQKRPEEKYYYPGGNFGGPVPGTHGKLLFWTGYEYFWQKLPGTNALTAWLPTQDMLNGNFGPTAANLAMCPNGMNANDGTLCSAVTGFDPNGNALSGTTIPVDPNALNLVKAYLKNVSPNVTPSAANGYANYRLPYTSQHNGYLFRQRLDYNVNENTKIFASYQYGNDGSSTPAHMWWNPGSSIPYGNGISQEPRTHTFSANFLHVFNPTLTNEVTGTWQQLIAPFTGNAISRSEAGFDAGTYYGASSSLPSLSGPWSNAGFVVDQADLFSTGGFPTQKIAYSIGDTVTKVYKNHTFKAGFRFEKVGNLQADWTYRNGDLHYDSKIQNDLSGVMVGTNNPMANLLMGIFSGYNENNKMPTYDLDNKIYSFFGQDDWKFNKRLTINLGARFERIGRWYDNTNIGMAVWLPGRYQQDLATGKAFPGVYWHGIDPGIPVTGAKNPDLAVSPRFGMAYDVFGNGKTVVRGGWGMYRWQDQPNGSPLQAGMDSQAYYSAGSRNVTMAELQALAGQGVNATVAWNKNSGVNAVDPNDRKNDYTQDWNFTISQQLPWRSMLEIAYIGNSTRNLLLGGQSNGAGGITSGYIDRNKMAKGALFLPDPVTGVVASDPENATLADYKPFRDGYGNNQINVGEHLGWANYNGLQVSWTKRSAHANINLNYTWSKSLGLVDGTVDGYDLTKNYGLLNIDRPHVFSASYSYELGRAYTGDMKLLAGAVNGWTFSGTTTIQSGANLQAQAGQNLNLQLQKEVSPGVFESLSTKTYFGTDVGMVLPTSTCGLRSGLKDKQLINMNCLAAPAIGQQGTLQFPYLYGPIYWNSDFSMYKTFKVVEGHSVQFRMSAFNFLNHALSGYSNNSSIQPKFNHMLDGTWVNPGSGNGVMNSISGRRVIELGVKYSF